MKRAFGEGIMAELDNPTSPRSVVLDNFYRTFWYSQGSPSLEDNFARLLVAQYQRRWNAAELTLGPLTPADYRVLRLPSGHVDPNVNVYGDQPKDSVRVEFAKRWNMLTGKLQKPPEDEASIAQLLVDTRDKMIEKDIDYNTYGSIFSFRRLSTCDDPHESMYRTFVFEGRDTGSQEFNTIFAALRQEFIENGPSPGYERLVIDWYEMHEEGEFCPPDDHVLRAAHETGMRRQDVRTVSLPASIILGS